jgi:hypothetical protein
MSDQNPNEIVPSIVIQEKDLAGIWANWAAVSHSPYEFTIDFARLSYGETPPSGIIVQRVNLSPLFVRQLIDTLEENWAKYAEKALPKEVE